MIFVLAGATAIAIDSSRVMRTKSMTSAALDAAALVTAKSLGLGDPTDAELQKVARAYFEQNLAGQNNSEGKFNNFTLVVDRDISQARLSVDMRLDTTIGRIFNVDAFTFNVAATARYDARDIELSMMLDVSGSMSGGKISDLRHAARDLAEIILDTSNGPSKNKIAIAPYSTAVNAGAFAETATGKKEKSTCVTERPGKKAFTDDDPFKGPLGKKAHSCPDNSVFPLSNDLGSVEMQIDYLEANGATAGHLGIAWAWYLVSPNWAALWPASAEPKAYGDPKVLKAVIIMTDGEFNTAYEGGNGNSSAQAEKLCANMKAAGLTLFAVAFEAPPAAIDVLSRCASRPRYFYNAANGGELRDSFKRIADELTGLRLTN